MNDTDKTTEIDAPHLESFLQRIERLQEEKKAIQADIKEVFAEAKAMGFDTKAMREVLKLRSMDAADRDELEYMIETYKRACNLA